jgi:PAS domain S-box-containing protein
VAESHARILVVDDQPMVVQVCAEILAEAGYQVRQACGGREALVRLEEERFDCLVADLRMPDVDGWTVLRRAGELDPDLTAIAITSYGSVENAIEALRAGARDLLLKPFDPDDLLHTVDEALAARRREQERLLLRARLPILEISQALMAEGDVESLAGRLLQVVARQSGAEQAALLLLDQEADELRVAAAIPAHKKMAEMRVPAGEGLARQALLGEESLVLEMPLPSSMDPLWPVFTAGPGIATVCVPLRSGEKAIGLLTLSRAERAGCAPFSPSDLNLLSITGSQIATALENARLYEALRRELKERVRAEEALRESEVKFRMIYETANAIIVAHDRDFKVVYMNPYACQVLGYEQGEMIGKDIRPMLETSEYERAEPVRQLVTSDPEMQIEWFEQYYLKKGGGRVLINWNVTALKDAEGKAIGILGVGQDITRRKQMEEALRESEERFRAIAEATPIPVVINRASDSMILYANQEYGKALGVPIHELLGHRSVDYYGDADERRIMLDKLFKDGRLESYELQGKRGDGTPFWTMVSALLLTFDGEQAIFTAFQDITERKRAEEALRESEERFRTIFAQSPVGIEIYDVSGKLIDANPACLEMFGVENVEAVRGFDLLADPNVLPEARSRLEQGETVKYETAFDFDLVRQQALYRTSKSGRFFVDCLIVPLRASDHSVTGYLVHVRDITERKRAEEALRESEEMFRSIFETSLVGVAICSTDKKWLYVNNQICKILGYSDQELRQMTWEELTHPDDLEADVSQYNRLLAGEIENYELEKRFVRKDGSVVYARVYISCKRNEHGAVEYDIGLLEDITERKRAEEALRRSEADLARAQQIGHMGSWDWDVVNTSLTWSDEIYRIWGVSRDLTPTYEGIEAMIHPEDRQKNEGMVQRFLKDLDAGAFEFRIVRPDGQVRHIYQRIEVSRDATGRAVRMFGIMHDITERKRAEEALRRERDRTQQYLDIAGVMLVAIDTQGQVILANRKTSEVLGYEEQEVLGKNWFGNFVPRRIREGLLPVSHMLLSGDVKGVEYHENPILTKAGEERLILWHNTAIRDEAGHIVGHLSSGEDITERKRAEEALRKRNEELGALNTVAAAVSRSLDLQEILNQALDKVLEVTGMETGSIYLLNQQAEEFVLATYRGASKEFADTVRTFRMGESLVGRVGQSGEPIVADDLTGDSRVTTTLVSKERIRSFAAIPMKSREKVQGLMNIASHQVHPFSPEEVRLYTAIANQIGVAIENARLYEETRQAEEALRHSLEQTARGERLLLALSQAAQDVQRAHTPEEVYGVIGDQITKLGYKATVFRLTDDGSHLAVAHMTFGAKAVRAAEKLTGLTARDYCFPVTSGSHYQRIMAEGQAVLDDPAAGPIADALPRALRPLAGRLAAVLGVEQTIYAPLRAGDQAFGLLAVIGPDLSEADVPAITAFANQAAIALENARLAEQLRTRSANLEELSAQLFRAQEEERRRLSLELHDELGQALTGIGFDLAAIEKEWPPEVAPEARERLASASALLADVDERVSDLALDLRPQMLDDLGLLPTLRWYVNRYTGRTGIAVELEAVAFEGRMTPEVTTAIYRVVQEALTNVAKHAAASRVTVRLECKAATVMAVVQDNGRGFEVEGLTGAPSRERGAGLLGMRERVTLLGGTCDIESRPGQGTRLTLEIPLRGETDHEQD